MEEATVQGLVAGVLAEAHAARLPPCTTRRACPRIFHGEAALRAVRILNGAGAPTLLQAMHRVVNAVRSGLIGCEVALYGQLMKWRRSNQSGRPLSMGNDLRLTGEGWATPLHSSDPALLHALRTRHSMDAVPYLNQARATYPGGVCKLDAALHLLHLPDGGLEVGKVTRFLGGASETPTRPRPTNPVYDGSKPTPPYAVMCEAFPKQPTWCPALLLATQGRGTGAAP